MTTWNRLGRLSSAALLGAALLAAALGCGAPTQPQQRRGELAVDAAPTTAGADVPLPAPPSPADLTRPQLVISELLTDPLLRDEGVGDYVEIANLAARRVPLAELALLLPSGRRLPLLRSARPWLEPGEVAVAQAWPTGDRLQAKGLRLPNAAGRLELLWRGQPIDAATWLRKRPWPKAKPGVAWERRSPALDGNLPAAWRAATLPVDRLERGSPGSVDWPCLALIGTALQRNCPPPLKKRTCRS
ncbi:MAG: hypothetical protein HY902_08785 [Deltaproteobacteria bacterium]|nr:hypothetical protein [Deltaproteobacteria bacterium]